MSGALAIPNVAALQGVFLFCAVTFVHLLHAAQRRAAKPAAAEPGVVATTKRRRANLENSVKPFHRHAILCGSPHPSSWPSRVEAYGEDDPTSLHGKFFTLTKYHDEAKGGRVRITLSDLPNTLGDFMDVIVYPEARLYRVNHQTIESFVCLLTDCSSPIPTCSMFQETTLPFSQLILVCAHSKRDKRCGERGPQAIKALQDRLISRETRDEIVVVAASSHVGGHEFSPTCVSYPSANFYGYLEEKSLDGVLDASSLSPCFRGNGLLSW